MGQTRNDANIRKKDEELKQARERSNQDSSLEIAYMLERTKRIRLQDKNIELETKLNDLEVLLTSKGVI